MSFKDSYNIYFGDGANTTQSITGSKAKQEKQPDDVRLQFNKTLASFMPYSEQVKTRNEENRKALAHLMEKIRLDSRLRQIEMFNILQKKDSNKKEHDVQRKCQNIASRIMRGKKVSAEELRFLAEHDPMLYLIAMLMRPPETDDEENDNMPEDEGTQEYASSDSSGGSAASAGTTGSSAQGAGEAAGVVA